MKFSGRGYETMSLLFIILGRGLFLALGAWSAEITRKIVQSLLTRSAKQFKGAKG
jgi:ABC-type transport system involved in multi-copper enzyme maturation permease subunit